MDRVWYRTEPSLHNYSPHNIPLFSTVFLNVDMNLTRRPWNWVSTTWLGIVFTASWIDCPENFPARSTYTFPRFYRAGNFFVLLWLSFAFAASICLEMVGSRRLGYFFLGCHKNHIHKIDIPPSRNRSRVDVAIPLLHDQLPSHESMSYISSSRLSSISRIFIIEVCHGWDRPSSEVKVAANLVHVLDGRHCWECSNPLRRLSSFSPGILGVLIGRGSLSLQRSWRVWAQSKYNESSSTLENWY